MARGSSPRRLALCPWRSVNAHQLRARLSSGSLGEQRRVSGVRGTQRRRHWPGRGFPRGPGAQAPRQAWPAPAGPRQRGGCASEERASASATLRDPRALGPGMLPSTNGRLRSTAPLRAGPGQRLRRLSGSGPTSPPAEALRRAHPTRPCLTRPGLWTPEPLWFRAHPSPERHHPHALEH